MVTKKRRVRISRRSVMLIGAIVWPIVGVLSIWYGARPGSLLEAYPVITVIVLVVAGVLFGLALPALVLWASGSRAHRNVLVVSTGAAFFTLVFADYLPRFILSRLLYFASSWLLVFCAGLLFLRWFRSSGDVTTTPPQ